MRSHQGRTWCSWCNDWAVVTTKRVRTGLAPDERGSIRLVSKNSSGFKLVYLESSYRWAILRPDDTAAHKGTKAYIEQLWKRTYSE
jgi:hypothetical protein